MAAPRGRHAALVLVDSLPVPVCRFARAHRCRSHQGSAAFGYDALAHQTYYGLRLRLRVTWPSVIAAAALAPANDADRAVAPSCSPACGAGRSAIAATGARAARRTRRRRPRLGRAVARQNGPGGPVAAPWPAWLVQARRRIETVLSQPTRCYRAMRIGARDPWHLAVRWLRKLLSHTVLLLCQRAGGSPLAFVQLVRT